jgi:hypothetical protein
MQPMQPMQPMPPVQLDAADHDWRLSNAGVR